MVGTPLGVVRYGFYAVFNPSAIISGQSTIAARTRRARLAAAARSVVFYLFNVFLYAVPLTYAGFGGTGEVGDAPVVVERLATALGVDPTVTWQYLFALLQNCSFLLLFSVLTFATFHTAVWLTRNSSGFGQSIQTVVYSTGIYLATIFSFTWYLSTSPEITVAEEWLIWLQSEFIYAVIDRFGADLELPAGRADPVSLAAVSDTGLLALVGLSVATLYYVYSLYLGARINHQSSRFAAVIAVGFVVVSPVLFVAGSILVALYADGSLIAAIAAITHI